MSLSQKRLKNKGIAKTKKYEKIIKYAIGIFNVVKISSTININE